MIQTDLIVNTNDDPIMKRLNEIRRNHHKSLVFAHVNINSVRSKFHNLADILNAGLIDVLAVTESKLDDSFPMNQFKLDGFKIIRNDFTKNSGGIMVIVRDDIAHARKSEYEHEILNVQCMAIEFLIRKEKWYFITYYKSPKVKNPDCIDCVKKMYDEVIAVAKETILFGDININMLGDNCFTNDICDVYNVTNLIDKPTCHKVERGTLFDPIIVSNRHRMATSLNVVCGYSDFHNLISGLCDQN